MLYTIAQPTEPVWVEEGALPYGARLAYQCTKRRLYLYQADCLRLMDALLQKHPTGCFDMIFADPPYFLSNGGFTCQSGKMVSVHKGDWDRLNSLTAMHEFNRTWLAKCQQLLKPNGTIWISGTMHNIFSVGLALQELEFKLLNDITWVKPNPPPNLSCRYFTHATETLIWAAKNKKSKHHFAYETMKAENGGKQMKSVWTIKPPEPAEKALGKHPTQKPVALLRRCIEAATEVGDFVFDPFAGSASTGVAAAALGRTFCGVELEDAYIDLSIRRLEGMKGLL
jgi:site-specific DNA-methyltransferase (adenine-specific)